MKQKEKTLEWYLEEMHFYDRMHHEVREEYDRRKEVLQTKHYYSKEEISAACEKRRLAIIDMELSNREYLIEHYKLSGLLSLLIKASDRYQKLYETVIKMKTGERRNEK